MKKDDFIHVAICITALAAANFLYQFVGNQHWIVAVERSWFQTIAVVLYAFWPKGR